MLKMLFLMVIHACALRAIDPSTFEKTSRSSQIWALLPRLVQLILVPNLSAGYRPAVLNAPIKKSQGLKSGDLGVLGWNFCMSLNRCTGEVNVLKLGTTLSGNCSRYSICAWITLPPATPNVSTVSVYSTFVKFGSLNDLI
jgi:hypothetical protein